MIGGLAEFSAVREEWNRLALTSGSPFLTHDWLWAWWTAFGEGEPACVLVRDATGALEAAALCRPRPGVLRSATNPESGDWDVLAAYDSARRRAWNEIAGLGGARVRWERIPREGAAAARRPSVRPATGSPERGDPSVRGRRCRRHGRSCSRL